MSIYNFKSLINIQVSMLLQYIEQMIEMFVGVCQ